MTGQVAVWTMVRDENYFLRLWVNYYSKFLPCEHIFILVDGADSFLPDGLDGCQIIVLPKSKIVEGWDERRWQFLSHFASALATRFDVVLGGDVDELVVLDPKVGLNPITYILERAEGQVISPFAIEVVHRIDLEPALSLGEPVLGQRRFGRLNASYCKPCIHRGPIRWSLGQHYADYPELILSKDLFLFHLRYLDAELLGQRQEQRSNRLATASAEMVADAAGGGWYRSSDEMQKHLQSFVERGPPEEGGFRFEWQREWIERSWKHDEKTGFWRHQRFHNRRTYVIPDRFAGLF